MEPTQGVLFYTEEEVNQKVADALDNEAGKTFRIIRDMVIAGIKEAVDDETIDRMTANAVFDHIIAKTGWDTTSFGVYNVTVYADGNEVGTVYAVEAQDEEEAVDLVENDFTVRDVTTTFQFSYNGTEFEGETYSDSWNHSIDFTFEASEADEY